MNFALAAKVVREFYYITVTDTITFYIFSNYLLTYMNVLEIFFVYLY